jgi:hypothetical protein
MVVFVVVKFAFLLLDQDYELQYYLHVNFDYKQMDSALIMEVAY